MTNLNVALLLPDLELPESVDICGLLYPLYDL